MARSRGHQALRAAAVAAAIVGAGSGGRASAAPDSLRIGVADTVTVLAPVRVEETRSVTPTRTTATSVRLDRARVTRFLPATSGDALVTVPGVDLVKTGPWASRLSLRGLAGDRVLLLVDGVRLNSARGHGGQVSMVPLERLDAVEVLQGASSAQFGSDALGGVVNLVTHRSLFAAAPAADLVLNARAATPGGSRSEGMRLRYATPRFGAEVAGGRGRLQALVTPDGRVPNSGNREEDLTARAAAQLGAATVDVEHTRRAARDVGLPAFNDAAGASAFYPVQARDADRLEIAAPGRGGRPDLRFLAVLQTFRTDFTESSVDSVFLRGRFVARRHTSAADRVRTRSWILQPSLRFPRLGELRLAAELGRETSGGPRRTRVTLANASGQVTSDSLRLGESVPPASRLAWSGSASATPLTGPFRLEVGLRYDALRARADSTATSHTAALDVTDRRLSAEAGIARPVGPVEPYVHVASGFRSPNLDERFFNNDIHGGLRLFGNPELRSERSVSYEAGMRSSAVRDGRPGSFRLSVFRSDVEDLISFRYVGSLYLVPRFQYFNVRRARLEGVEATGGVRLAGVDLQASGALPRGVDRETGKRLLDAGAARVTLDAIFPVPLVTGGSVALRARWSDAVRGVEPIFARPSFWTASAEVAAVAFGTRAVVAVHNLLDASYREPLSFIPEPKRTFALSLKRAFDLPLPGPRGERP